MRQHVIRWALGLCLLCSGYAVMAIAATGNVVTPVGNNGVPIQAIQLGTSQNVSYNASGGASTPSTAFGASTTLIAVALNVASGDSGVRVAIAASPTASSTTSLLPASGVYYFSVMPAWKIAVLSNNATTGTINVTEAVSWQ